MSNYFNNFIRELFYVLSGALVILPLTELAWPGIVLAYFNINWLLILWLIDGMVILILPHRRYTNKKITNR